MTPLRIAFVEWPEALSTGDTQWSELKKSVTAARPDILITNELPFGPWLADSALFSEDEAQHSIRAHQKGLEGLIDLDLPVVISSRPVWNGKRLANEAFVLENRAVRPLHRKQYFPNEPGWFEREWYAGDDSGFGVAEMLGIKVGVLLCTEAMFNERARAYGKEEASLVVIPRTTGEDMEQWKIAGAMASLVSGAYVVSSSRVGRSKGGTCFGGGGFAYAPHGRLLAMTTLANPVQTLELDPKMPPFAQRAYPCYVPELESGRIHEALDPAIRRTESERAAQLVKILPQLEALLSKSTKIAIKTKGRTLFIDPANVAIVQAEGNYVLMQRQLDSYLLRESISTMAERLKPWGFIRIHRSVLVNSSFVEEIQPRSTGEYVLRIKGGKEYTVSRTYKKNLSSIPRFWVGTETFVTE